MALAHFWTFKLVTKLAKESGSTTAMTRTSGTSVCKKQTSQPSILLSHTNKSGRVKKKIRRTLDLSNDLVDVVLVVGSTVVGNAELSVGGLGSTVTVGEVVYSGLYQWGPALSISSGEILTKGINFCGNIHPEENRNVSNFGSTGREC